MNIKHLIRVAGVGGLFLAATAFAGLPWADANPATPSARTADVGSTHLDCVHVEGDDPAICGIMRQGPRGPRGRLGKTGPRGHIGKTGPIGLTGAKGLTGVVGPQGSQGPQGLQGVQGAPGHTVVVAGTQVSVTAPAAGEPQGTQLTPSVAQCPSASSGTPEAYGGGVQIQKSGTESSGDVVAIQQQVLGTYASPTSVTLPSSSPSTTAANAYEGQAVVTQLTAGDTATVQAFVICGP